MYNNLIDSLNIILAVLSTIISPVILFVGWLMSPDWTSGDLFGLRTPMYTLWVTVSNIVYFVYAILLILIALGTMFGKESFSYKVMLPKLALGILMVPFTWWFVQWTISLASVVTASVISIPLETMNSIESQKPSIWFSKKESIPTSITIWSGATISSDCTKPWECITPKKFMESSAGMYGPMVVYAYSIFKFDKVQKLETGVDMAKAALSIVHTSIISVIMFTVFWLLVLALAAMLLVRAIKLWVYAIFSPLFTFQFVAGWAMKWVDSSDTFTIKEFVGLCFVPAIVGLSLSFGLILIAAVHWTNGSGWSTTPPCDLTQWCSILNIMGSPSNTIFRKWDLVGPSIDYTTSTIFTWWPTKINFIGKASTQIDPMTTTVWALDSLGGMFGTIIIDIIALVFIWMAFMAAKNVSKAVKMAVEPFEKIGQQVGSLAKSIPKYTPIPGLGMSMSGMEKGIGKVEQWFKDNRANEDAKSPLGQLLGLEAAARKETVKAIENIKTANKDSMNSSLVGDALKQVSLETKWNKAEKTAELMNAVLEKYANKDAKWKVTWFDEGKIRDHFRAMNIEWSDLDTIKNSYMNKWPIAKTYLENEGNYIYKKIYPNASIGEATKTSTAESTGGSGKPATPEPPKPEIPKTPPTQAKP